MSDLITFTASANLAMVSIAMYVFKTNFALINEI